MPMRHVIVILTFIYLGACAQAPKKRPPIAKKEKMIQEFCQQNGAFDRGFADGNQGSKLNTSMIKELCGKNNQRAMNLYNQGFQQGRHFLNTPSINTSSQATDNQRPVYHCQLKIFEEEYQAFAPERQQAVAKIIQQCRQEREDHFFCADETINCYLANVPDTGGKAI